MSYLPRVSWGSKMIVTLLFAAAMLGSFLYLSSDRSDDSACRTARQRVASAEDRLAAIIRGTPGVVTERSKVTAGRKSLAQAERKLRALGCE